MNVVATSELSDEELESLVEFDPSSYKPKFINPVKTDVDLFIESVRIKRGTKKIPFENIWTMYCIWSSDRMSKVKIGAALSARFDKKKTKYRTYYKIKY